MVACNVSIGDGKRDRAEGAKVWKREREIGCVDGTFGLPMRLRVRSSRALYFRCLTRTESVPANIFQAGCSGPWGFGFVFRPLTVPSLPGIWGNDGAAWVARLVENFRLAPLVASECRTPGQSQRRTGN